MGSVAIPSGGGGNKVVCSFTSSRGADPGVGSTYAHAATCVMFPDKTFTQASGYSAGGFTLDNDYFTLTKTAKNNATYTIYAKHNLIVYNPRTQTITNMSSGETVTIDAYALCTIVG